jgi:hypothetical protein
MSRIRLVQVQMSPDGRRCFTFVDGKRLREMRWCERAQNRFSSANPRPTAMRIGPTVTLFV